MPATGLRRAFDAIVLLGLALGPAYSDAHADVVDLVASMAAALSAVNVPEFMNAFDKNMTDYEALKGSVTALVNQAEVTSSIEPIQDEGDDAKRMVDLDWYLEVRSLLQDGPIVRRREVVHCELRKEKKKWKIVALTPPSFFAPAKLDK
jgi:hypothetical protein